MNQQFLTPLYTFYLLMEKNEDARSDRLHPYLNSRAIEIAATEAKPAFAGWDLNFLVLI